MEEAVFSCCLTAPDQFKTYEQLQNRLQFVLGQKSTRPTLDEEVQEEDNDRGSFKPNSPLQQETPKPAPVVSKDEDEDDALSYFQRLADE